MATGMANGATTKRSRRYSMFLPNNDDFHLDVPPVRRHWGYGKPPIWAVIGLWLVGILFCVLLVAECIVPDAKQYAAERHISNADVRMINDAQDVLKGGEEK
jgi:hypothetical protein